MNIKCYLYKKIWIEKINVSEEIKEIINKKIKKYKWWK